MHKKFLTLTTGFALFSMFFGSGNLVFPIEVGQAHPTHALAAALGILLTGVGVPFLGVYTMCLFHGDNQQFFKCFGSKGPFWFSLVCLGLMGPFGVMARCLTVAHGSLHLLWPKAELTLTSLALCVVIYFFTRNKTRIIHLLGNLLTPGLLLSLSALAYFGLQGDQPPSALTLASHTTSVDTSWQAFKEGFLQGYQTMDLLAAFFFSTFIFKQLMHAKEDTEASWAHTRSVIWGACFVGGALLASAYVVMVSLGARYSQDLAILAPQDMLGQIALITLGNLGGPIVCAAVVLACLTTAIVLTSLFASFLSHEALPGRCSERMGLFVTLIIGFGISTLDFAGIARFLGPILAVVYPSMIALTFLNLAHKRWNWPVSHWPATLILALKLWSL